MKLFLTILMFFAFLNANSQAFHCNDIIGKWTVKNVDLVGIEGMQFEKSEKVKLDSMKNGFINSTFIFNSDNTFQISFNQDMPKFMKELLFINNKRWKCKPEESSILIGTDADNFSLMGIEFRVQDEDTIFILTESPFILNVKKE